MSELNKSFHDRTSLNLFSVIKNYYSYRDKIGEGKKLLLKYSLPAGSMSKS